MGLEWGTGQLGPVGGSTKEAMIANRATAGLTRPGMASREPCGSYTVSVPATGAAAHCSHTPHTPHPTPRRLRPTPRAPLRLSPVLDLLRAHVVQDGHHAGAGALQPLDVGGSDVGLAVRGRVAGLRRRQGKGRACPCKLELSYGIEEVNCPHKLTGYHRTAPHCAPPHRTTSFPTAPQ